MKLTYKCGGDPCRECTSAGIAEIYIDREVLTYRCGAGEGSLLEDYLRHTESFISAQSSLLMLRLLQERYSIEDD